MRSIRDLFRLKDGLISRQAARGWLALILVLGLILRLAVLIVIGQARVPWQLEFEEIANSLVEQGSYLFSFYGLTSLGPTSFIPPVYPLLLAGAEILWPGYGDWLVKGLQIAAGCAVIACLYALTREAGANRGQGLLAAFFWAIYPPAIAYSSDLSTVSLEIFFMICGIWLIVRAVKRNTPGLGIPAGILLALAALTRSTWLVALGEVLIWVLFQRHSKWKTKGILAVLFVLSAILVFIPWVLHNHSVLGKWTPSSSNGGLNFWIGNNPQATGEYVFPTVMDEALVLQAAELSESERDTFFYAQALEFVKDSPNAFFNLLGRKTLYAFFFRPNIGSNYQGADIPIFNLAIYLFIVSWLILLPMAIYGLFQLRGYWGVHSLFLLVFLANLILSILYFTGTRFRTPVEGFVVIWAAIWLGDLLDKRLKNRFMAVSQQPK